MPMSEAFQNRLFPIIKAVAEHFGTPFHIYDETGIRETGFMMIEAFSGIKGFREYFAVKALPNPTVLDIMRDMGFGFDCSSVAELILSRGTGARGEDIMFTSNNTSAEEFRVGAAEGGCILNLDDISLIPKVPEMPELICFRYNPGPRCRGNAIIGNPEESKYGITFEQAADAYRQARERGAKRFGLHTMVVSNELNYIYKIETARLVLELAEHLTKELGIEFEFVNMGGGIGIPYRPEDRPFDLRAAGEEMRECFRQFKNRNGYMPKLYLESGRYMTGPHGVLVSRAINRKNIYRTYIGVDACMSALMRPGMYGAYHHISVPGKDSDPKVCVADVVGALCENNDKFAIQRELPDISDGDILVVHDTGAHGQSMGFNYNGRLRPKELLLRADGSVSLIRREETVSDYFATLGFAPDTLMPGKN